MHLNIQKLKFQSILALDWPSCYFTTKTDGIALLRITFIWVGRCITLTVYNRGKFGGKLICHICHIAGTSLKYTDNYSFNIYDRRSLLGKNEQLSTFLSSIYSIILLLQLLFAFQFMQVTRKANEMLPSLREWHYFRLYFFFLFFF